MRTAVVKTVSASCIVALLFVLSCSFGEIGVGQLDAGSILVVCLVGVAIYRLLRDADEKRFKIGLFGAVTIGYLLFIAINNSTQVSDFQNQIEAARAYLDGDHEVFREGFFVAWPDTLGYTLIECFLLSLCNKVFFIKAFEVLCSAGTVVVAYSCMRAFSSTRPARVAACMLALFPTFALMPQTANNQVLSAFLAMLAVRLFMKLGGVSAQRNRFALCFACGLLVAIARFVRPDAVLVEIALVAVLLVFGMRELCGSDGKIGVRAIVHRLSECALLLVPYLLTGVLLSCALTVVGLKSPEATGDEVFINKLVMGTDLSTGGTVGGDYPQRIREKMEQTGLSYNEAGLLVVGEQVDSANTAGDLIIAKTKKLWWGSWLHFCLIDNTGSFRRWVFGMEKGFVAVLCSAVILSLIRVLKRASGDKGRLQSIAPFAAILFLTILAYVFIEVQPRYLYFCYITMFVISSYGLDRVCVSGDRADAIR